MSKRHCRRGLWNELQAESNVPLLRGGVGRADLIMQRYPKDMGATRGGQTLEFYRVYDLPWPRQCLFGSVALLDRRSRSSSKDTAVQTSRDFSESATPA